MAQRLRMASLSGDSLAAMRAFSKSVNGRSLEAELLELVKIRAPQINGCAYCLALHISEARKLGVSDDRIHLLNAWQESPVFSDRERAVLLWMEALTNIQDGHVADDVYYQVHAVLSELEIADLTFEVAAINSWNRFQFANRAVPVFT